MSISYGERGSRPAVVPPVRPEFECTTLDASNIGDIARPLSLWERLTGIAALRRLVIIVSLCAAWQLYAQRLDNPLMLPTFTDTIGSLWAAVSGGVLLLRIWVSIKVLLIGYAVGIAIAAVLTTFAISTRIGTDILTTLTAMFNPLPAIALLPLAMLWFGLGTWSIVFVLIHAVLWPVSLNASSGFLAVSETLRMAGYNCGLGGIRFVVKILIPAAFPSILSGLKIGWAFAWRTLIAAELVFGVSSGSGGIGWFIFESRTLLDIAAVFAGLLTVIIIGLFMESIVFRSIEERTVRRWGMQR